MLREEGWPYANRSLVIREAIERFREVTSQDARGDLPVFHPASRSSDSQQAVNRLCVWAGVVGITVTVGTGAEFVGSDPIALTIVR